MDMVSIIEKKRDGGKLSSEEIGFFVNGYTTGDIPDYQASAFLMAVCIRGMDKEETFSMTGYMRDSGETVDLSGIKGIKVDKHSTGGVGDKTTFIAGPLAAACGIPVAKMSGRGLGFTGGTVDKMESVPGMRTALDRDEFIHQVNDTGLAVTGQTGKIAPADKRIYALRDVTGTVNDLSLISSSIMSKKLASGCDAILLDVKCGKGAFMQNYEDACNLAEMMTQIGRSCGKKTVAAVTDMDQPLGRAVGNSLEVMEAIETLKGRGPQDITELSLVLSGLMVYMGGKASSPEAGRRITEEKLYSGDALKKFRAYIAAQGGDPEITENKTLFPQPDHRIDIKSEDNGYVYEIGADRIGRASLHTGAGRRFKDDIIDLSAGIYICRKVGEKVSKGDILAVLQGNSQAKLLSAAEECRKAFRISAAAPEKKELVKSVIGLE